MTDIKIKKDRYTFEDCIGEIIYFMQRIENGYNELAKRDSTNSIEYIEQKAGLKVCIHIAEIIQKYRDRINKQEEILGKLS